MEKFRDMEYKRPDLEKTKAAFSSALSRFENAESYEAARKAFLDFEAEETELETMYTIAHIRNTMNTLDAFYDAEMHFFGSEIPKLELISRKRAELLIKSPFRKEFEAEFGAQIFRMAERDVKTASEEIVPLSVRENELSMEYSKTSASCKTDFRGEECNFYGLLKHMQSTDRTERREAFLAWSKMLESISPELDRQYDELVRLRVEQAKRLGFDSYTELAYYRRGRFDYTAKDVEAFRRSIREIVTPACDRLHKEQAKRLGVDKLRYYDESLIFPEGNAVPFGTTEEKVAAAQKMYHEMSKETGEFFDFMVEHELFDLETRPGKRLGGYCTEISGYKAPFIFSNFNGTSADVDVLTHEAGHAFEGYLTMRSLPLKEYTFSTSEINEIHSMTMEHFAYPYMERFFGENTQKYLYAHLADALMVVPYMAAVDEFQHRVYAQPDMTALDRRKVWHELEKAYLPWRDYEGNEFLEEGGFWMQKQHIFLYPFYYIDYALAQMCAFQYYGLMKENREKAWENYLTLCRAGGSRGYFELLKVGSLRCPFERESVEYAVNVVTSSLTSGKF